MEGGMSVEVKIDAKVEPTDEPLIAHPVTLKSARALAAQRKHALAILVVPAFGTAIATPHAELSVLSPDAARMCSVAAAEIAALGVVGTRARCLVALAHAAAERRIVLGLAADVEEQIERLTALPGIGPWTADIYLLSCLGHADAWPAGDLALQEAAKVAFALK